MICRASSSLRTWESTSGVPFQEGRSAVHKAGAVLLSHLFLLGGERVLFHFMKEEAETHVLSTLPKIAQLVSSWIMIETLFTLQYVLVPRTLHVVRKGMFRKDSYMRQVKSRKDWLGKALQGVEIKEGLAGWADEKETQAKLALTMRDYWLMSLRRSGNITKVWIFLFLTSAVLVLSSGSALCWDPPPSSYRSSPSSGMTAGVSSPHRVPKLTFFFIRPNCGWRKTGDNRPFSTLIQSAWEKLAERQVPRRKIRLGEGGIDAWQPTSIPSQMI